VLDWIRAQRADGSRWFAFINHMEPHLPYQPVVSIRDRRLGGRARAEDLRWAERFGPPLSLVQGLGVTSVSTAQRDLLSELYDGEIESVDREIGKFLGTLRDEGALDDLLVVITSDHGENIGDHGLYDHRLSLNRSLLHVPLVVRLPGVFDGGREVGSVARLEDVAATVFEVCELTPATPIDGVSLTGDLEGRIARATHGTLERMEVPLRTEFPSLDTRRLGVAIRSAYDGQYHLIRYADGRAELYDVRSDPAETLDLSTTQTEVVKRLTPLCDPF
jgi:arylsulfatase A-like enzyme